MRPLIIIVVFLLLSSACNNQAGEQEVEKQTLSDSLFDEVMAGHDVAMPKMMKLERLQKQVKTAMDSIKKMSTVKQNALTDYKIKLDNTAKALDYADMAMNKWMQEFKYDSLKNNESERIQYLRSELNKVNKMKEAVLGSISQADSLFGK